MQSINCKGNLLNFDSPKIMGVVNLSFNSFYANSVMHSIDEVVDKVNEMINAGVDIIDIGGQSTRPGCKILPPEVELKTVIPAVKILKKLFPKQILSVDTYYTVVAQQSYDEGADIINDISGGMIDAELFPYIFSNNIPYICNHIIGSPENMQDNIIEGDIVLEVLNFMRDKELLFKKHNFTNWILDIGIGFSKTAEQNITLINNLEAFKIFQKPILVGLSRKSFIRKILNIDVNESLNGTSLFNYVSLCNGAKILRVHDVKEAKECVTVYNYCYQGEK